MAKRKTTTSTASAAAQFATEPSGITQSPENARFEFIEKASEILASSLDFKTTLKNVAELAVPFLADWCAVDVCGGDRCDDIAEVQRLAVMHVDQKKVALAYELEAKYPPDPSQPSGLHHVLRTGETEFVEELPDKVLQKAAVDAEHLALIRSLGLVSYIIAPLKVRDKVLGAITFVTAESHRRYGVRDIALAEDIARRAAVAIDNAILYKQVTDAEARLREQFEFTNAIMQSLADGIYALDKEGNVTYMNPAAERVLGWRAGEIRGRNMHEVIHYMSPDGVRTAKEDCPLLRVLSAGLNFKGEDNFIHRNGSFIPIEFNSAPIISESMIKGAVLAFRDISERREHEESLLTQREWFSVTLSSIGDAVIATDTEGIVTFLNPTAQTLTGWTLEDAEGRQIKEIFNIINEQTGELAINPVDRVLESGQIVGLANHTSLISRDGRETPIDDSAAPIRDRAGKILGVVLVFRDISDRKRAEEVMRRSTQRTSRVLETISDAFASLDREGRFTYVNKRAQELFFEMRGTDGDVTGKSVWAEFPDLIWTDFYEKYNEALREQEPVQFEMQFKPLDRWHQVNAYPSLDGISIFFQDVTDRKRIELDRVEYQSKAELAVRRFNELVRALSGISWQANPKTMEFSFVSDEVERILGYAPEQWTGDASFWTSIIHPADRDKAIGACTAAAADGVDREVEYRAQTKDGRTLWLRNIVYAAGAAEGQADSIRGVMIDVTSTRGNDVVAIPREGAHASTPTDALD